MSPVLKPHCWTLSHSACCLWFQARGSLLQEIQDQRCWIQGMGLGSMTAERHMGTFQKRPALLN